MLQLESEGAGVDKQMLTNSLFCVMKSLKCYVNIEGELFTFYQQGKFPLTRSRFLPHAVIFFHGNFFFPNIVFTPFQEQKRSSGSWASQLPQPPRTNQEHGVSGGVQAPTPHIHPDTQCPPTCPVPITQE